MADPTPTVLPQVRELAPNDVVGNYRIDKPLGEGGMAQVYAVTHVHVGTRAALKIPRHGLDQAMFDRFLIEARAHMGLVGSAHIVPPMEVAISEDRRPYLVTRLMTATLDAWRSNPANQLDDSDRELSQWLRFGIQMAMGLDAAHSHQPAIVHRDLKPANIYVEPRTVVIAEKEVPLVQIGDFGLAWSVGDENTPMGTPEYVSPEHSAGEPPTPRSDLYSLGVVLYELLEGTRPFEHSDTVQLLMMQRHNPVPRLRNTVVRDRLPELEELLNRLLAKNEADRPANARVVVNELQSLLRQFERRNERTNVGVDPRRLLEAKPTDVLPKPSPEAEAAFLARPQPAPSEAEPRTTRSRAFLILPLLFIALGVAWGVSRLFQDPVVIDEPKPVLPPIVLPPPVVLPVLEPVDSGSSGEELAPVNPVIVQKVKPPPVRTCVPNQAWRDRMKLDLDDLESKGTNMGAAELERAIESLYLSMKSAKSPEDCGRVEHRFEELVKKAIK
ncbi:MAG: serine/threonine-protein kinase [Myxococcaceae bacterium]